MPGVSSGPNPWWSQVPTNNGAPGQPGAGAGGKYQDPSREFDSSGNGMTYTGSKIGHRAGDALKALQSDVPGLFAPDTWNSNGGGVGGPGVPQVPQVAGVDNSAANAAIFARSKDKVGETSRGALTGLRSALGGRGMLGSGAESRGTAAVVQEGQGQLGDTIREGAIQDTAQANKNATTNYEGSITQRGQDLQARAEHERIALQQQQVRQQQLADILNSLKLQLY